ncbi:predicted protein [Candida tropicalis MYA-3404]|uniref:Uncharacterized protein n=1 Tax=Candida tropicalis (strain ATCC MYA-3404 / T1) TaxID=294747 RepID=C5M846_CANTT|nr:predicted protein [Candida tropicalis MYA-3404]EER33750.1 predicted protein [Candida tropicalis MYA-3404]KAG4407598.1 hypothetical protein JTP64_003133 [Candida tropicalis]
MDSTSIPISIPIPIPISISTMMITKQLPRNLHPRSVPKPQSLLPPNQPRPRNVPKQLKLFLVSLQLVHFQLLVLLLRLPNYGFLYLRKLLVSSWKFVQVPSPFSLQWKLHPYPLSKPPNQRNLLLSRLVQQKHFQNKFLVNQSLRKFQQKRVQQKRVQQKRVQQKRVQQKMKRHLVKKSHQYPLGFYSMRDQISTRKEN